MKILIANDGYHAHYFERMSWANAFNSDPNTQCIIYYCRNFPAFDAFNKVEPDIFIGQLYNLDRATIKCIEQRPHMKVALRAGEFNAEINDPHILRATDEEISTLEALRERTGKPDFLYTHYLQSDISKTHAGFEKLGYKLVGIPMSGDLHVYGSPVYNPALACDIGFVGGYWPYKGQVLNKWLVPLCYKQEYKIKVFGNQPWPHISQYCGTINDTEVASLFVSAKICPNLSEPHAHTYGIDVNERAFKILAAGGFCIMDNVKAAINMLDSGVIFADTPGDFSEKIAYYMDRPKERERISHAGKSLIWREHSNFNRAQTFLVNLGEEQAAERLGLIHNDYINRFFKKPSLTA